LLHTKIAILLATMDGIKSWVVVARCKTICCGRWLWKLAGAW